MAKFTLRVNNRVHSIDIDDPDMPLLYALRDDLGLHGPKFGCGLGQCGACALIRDMLPRYRAAMKNPNEMARHPTAAGQCMPCPGYALPGRTGGLSEHPPAPDACRRARRVGGVAREPNNAPSD